MDAAWFAARLARALALREALFDAPFYRLVHAEADGLPGVIVDRFGDAAAVQPNAAWAEARLDALVAALRAVDRRRHGGQERRRPGARAGRAAREETAVLAGRARRPGRRCR